MDGEHPRISVTIDALPGTVWSALRDPNRVRQWHGWDYDALDHEIETIYFSRVNENAENHALQVAGGDVFTIDPEGNGCRVTLTRARPSGDPAEEADYRQITEGWLTFLQQLRFAEERQSRPRRTHFFSSTKSLDEVLDGLGLRAARGLDEGAAYRARALGTELNGVVWFNSVNQLGLTVDAWHGLLILAGSPDGCGTMAVLSTYDLSDGEFEELGGQWGDWWN